MYRFLQTENERSRSRLYKVIIVLQK